MSASFPVAHSILDPGALRAAVLSGYDIGEPVLCALLPPGINDSYLVRTRDGAQYVLRVYRAGWRTAAAIGYEMDLLVHLRAQAVPVAVPLARREGAYWVALAAPEGVRQVALFSFAPGTPLDRDDARHYAALGNALAAIHQATDDFASPHPRAALDPEPLIAWSLARMEPYFTRRREEWDELRDAAAALSEHCPLPATLDWGPCHGDPYPGNAHRAGDGTLTYFDFDCCGPGCRAYDLAGVRWFLEHTRHPATAELWQAFLGGYLTARPLAPADLSAIPYFVAVRALWHNALGAVAVNLGERQYDRFGRRAIAMLRAWREANEARA